MGQICIWVTKAISIDDWEADYFNHMSLCAGFGATELLKSTKGIHGQMGEANTFTSGR